MANHDVSNAEFNSELRRYETTDRGSASVFNENEKVLINNDVYLNDMIRYITLIPLESCGYKSLKFKDARNTGNPTYSTILGTDMSGDGSYSFSAGSSNIVEAEHCMVGGWYNSAFQTPYIDENEGISRQDSGDCSAIFGYGNQTRGNYCFSAGFANKANEDCAVAFGYGNIANHYNFSIGKKCKEPEKSSRLNTTQGDAFIIGNGNIAYSESPGSNAFRVNYKGSTYGMSAFNSTGADYAEFFEWSDGNPNNEDRVGHFVTFENDKIKIANTNDDYILGIISGNPSVIGNSHNDMWNEMYIRDEFGRIVYEDVEVPDTFKTIHHDAVYENQNINPLDIDTNKESNILISEAYDEEVLDEPKHMEHRMKLNPKYDPSHEYIPREKRPEWSAVGMFGVLSVYDDGTCTVNGYAKVSNNGTATKSDNGYRVLKRVTNNIVKILFRS